MGVVSMTGFARAEGDDNGLAWIWEVKSVNGRSLDLRVRLAAGFDALEPRLRAELSQRFRRGNFSATLTVTRTVPPPLRVNRQALAQLVALMNELRGEIDAAPPRLDGLLAVRGIVETVEDEAEPAIEERRLAILAGWAATLDRLAAARLEEGARLSVLMESQIVEMTALVDAAGACAAAQPEALRERLRANLESLADLAPTIPEERIVQELALLATRSDVREEIERLRAHLDQAAELLSQSEPVGRRLDFLCQELNREANTLCAKSADIELTRIGMSLKAVIEQFREQVQNIE
ncbi:MAG TPA: YicC/YloC family endoribonuclease [Stellaceae bacterium]|nr:YicC/YloC family endoribonuclease [Stellaceae bacterium]